LRLIKQHAMKTGEVQVSFYVFSIMSVNGSLQLHIPAALLLKKAPVTTSDRRLSASKRWCGCNSKQKSSLHQKLNQWLTVT